MSSDEQQTTEGEVIETGALIIRPQANLSPADRISQMTAGLIAVEAFQVAARRLALKSTRPNDWRTWNNRLRPEVSAADSIAATFGVKISDVLTEKKNTNNGFQIIATGTFELPMSGYSVEGVMGSCRSDDDIVATRYEYDSDTRQRVKREIPAGDVDEATVTKKALANMRVNGIMSLFGLRNVTAEELFAVGISVGETQKTSFQNKLWEMSKSQKDILVRFHASEAELESCKSNQDVTGLLNKLKVEKRKAPAASNGPAEGQGGAKEAVSAPDAGEDPSQKVIDNLHELAEALGWKPEVLEAKLETAQKTGLGGLKSLQQSMAELCKVKR